tara:strand:- start:6476 stop:8608 length:2133 start_codon:yes stop_codon:yes gene_type:complete
MAKEIDLSGIAAGVGQANRARQKYLKDAFEDERNERLGAAFVKPFVEETVIDGPERRRKERLEIQMRDPNLTKKINDAKADLIKTRSETLKSTFDRIENNPNGLEAGARVIAEELMADSEIGKTFLGSGIFTPNHPKYTFVSNTLINQMKNLYKERIDKQAELVLKTHNEIKDSGILKDYDIGNAYKMSQANYDKLSAGVSLDVESSDIFRQGVNKLFGDNDAADVANLYNQASMIQNKIDKFYNESEKFVNLNKTIVKIDDKLETYLSSVNSLNEEDFNTFRNDELNAINSIGTANEQADYKRNFTTPAGVLAQWNEGDLIDKEKGLYTATPTRLEGSRESVNPFGKQRIGLFGLDELAFDISAVSEENITYRERAIVDGNLVEKEVFGEAQTFRKYLGFMVTRLAAGLKFEAERNRNPQGSSDYVIDAYRLLAKNGYIRMKDATNIEKGLILVKPLNNSTVISGSEQLSADERSQLGIDNLYNMSVNRTIKDAKESGGGTDEDIVPNIIANAEKDLEEEIDNTQDVEKREQLFTRLDDVNSAKLSDNEARRLLLKELIAPTKTNRGKPYVYDESVGLIYNFGELTKEDAESIYKQLLIQNGVDSDPEIRGLIDVARFKGDDNSNSIDSQMLRIGDVDRQSVPFAEIGSNILEFNERMQRSSDFKKLQDYAEGTRTFIQPRQLEKLFTKYNLGQNPTREKVQEFLKDNS